MSEYGALGVAACIAAFLDHRGRAAGHASPRGPLGLPVAVIQVIESNHVPYFFFLPQPQFPKLWIVVYSRIPCSLLLFDQLLIEKGRFGSRPHEALAALEAIATVCAEVLQLPALASLPWIRQVRRCLCVLDSIHSGGRKFYLACAPLICDHWIQTLQIEALCLPSTILKVRPLQALLPVFGLLVCCLFLRSFKYLLHLFRFHVDRMDLDDLVPCFKHGVLRQALVLAERAFLKPSPIIGLLLLDRYQLLLQSLLVYL